jgi:serine/threonine protein kinase
MVKNEIANMTKLIGNPNIVTLFDVYRDDTYTYLVEELCEGPSLHDAMQASIPLTQIEIWHALQSIVNAISSCHDQGIVFCDLKPANVVYSNDDATFKLADFGSSFDTHEHRQLPITGTQLFIAPELNMVKGVRPSFPNDVWSIGIIAYMLIFGKHPFQTDENTFQPLVIPLLRSQLQFPSQDRTAVEFISKALTFEPNKRPTAHELLSYFAKK